MRDYGVVSPRFWIGETGKTLRGNANAQILALYLMTCPHANMIGVFHCPLIYMAHETGIGLEGASKALECLIEAQFCTFDEASDTVFVHRMPVYQVGESLKPTDLRTKGVCKEWQNIAVPRMKAAFHAMYSVAFHLPDLAENSSPYQAPTKPLPSQEQEQEQEQDHRGLTSPPSQPRPEPAGFVDFWETWPKSSRKAGRSKCLDVWKRAGIEKQAAQVIAHVVAMKATHDWQKDSGQFVPAPLVYLNGRRWDGAEIGEVGKSDLMAGVI